MADGTSFPLSAHKLGKVPGTAGLDGVKKRATAAFGDLAAEEERGHAKAGVPADTVDLRHPPSQTEPTPGELIKKVQAAQGEGSDRGFSITRGPDGKTTVRISGRIDPSVYAEQKLQAPSEELRPYAQSTQQWLLLKRSFQVSVVDFQALLATKLKNGEISRAEAREALRAHFPPGSTDSGPPILRFLNAHPEYKDLFGVMAEP